MDTLITLWLANAAFFALFGTNTQARLARERLLADTDPLIATAARLWRPVRCLMTPTRRRERAVAEAAIRIDPARSNRYDRLRQELSAWNALESSVALAAVAALVAFVISVV
jgi:hypothetical protein